jgi:DNA-binding PadR family transcriptional regulator
MQTRYLGEFDMTCRLRHLIYEKLSQASNVTTDLELYNALAKAGVKLSESRFNKTLLDLEILGLIKVSWVTKGKRRIELVGNQ